MLGAYSECVPGKIRHLGRAIARKVPAGVGFTTGGRNVQCIRSEYEVKREEMSKAAEVLRSRS
jgi:hypothetical protein